MGLADLLKDELKALCVEHELATDGTKSDLVARLEPVLSWDNENDGNEAEEGPIEAEEASEGGNTASEGDDDSEQPQSDDAQFIHDTYMKVLGHGPDEGHMNHYCKMLLYGNMSRDDVTYGIENCMEALRLNAELSEDE